MSTSVSSVSKHFPSAEAGFTTTLASTISSGAVTVPLNSVAGYANGEVVAFIVDPSDNTKKQAFTGTVDTAGVQITGVVWTSGTNQTHTTGSTVVDYASATHISMISKGLLVEHNQNGTHGAITATSVTSSGAISGTTGTFTSLTVSGTATSQGWTALGATPNTITANATVPRVYDLVFNSTDLTSTLSSGMKLQFARTVAAPSQCTSLNGTTQYYSRASAGLAAMTFTDDFVVSAWIKLTSYAATDITIASRYNGTSGWELRISVNGQPQLLGYSGGAANYSQVQTYSSIPLNKWVHIAAQLDMSTFLSNATSSYVMVDGVDVTSAIAASSTRGGTNPTSLIQAGNLEIGSRNGGLTPFPGKIAQVAIYSAKVTQATLLASKNQGLSGSETSLISAYSFNGVVTDLSSNGYTLTANGSAVATNPDSPFANAVTAGSLEYAEVLATSFSTNTTVTVRVPETCQIPTSGGISSVLYSTHAKPYGLPYFTTVLNQTLLYTSVTTSSGTMSQISGLTLPIYAPTNSKIRITFWAKSFNNSSALHFVISELWDGVVSSGTVIGGATAMSAVNSAESPASIIVLQNVSGGLKTYNMAVATDGTGTGNISANAGQKAILLEAELV